MDFQSVDHSLAFDQIDNQLNVDPLKKKEKRETEESAWKDECNKKTH